VKITQSEGGSNERETEIQSVQVPDLWQIANWLKEEHPELVQMGKPAWELVLECLHTCHDLKTALIEIEAAQPPAVTAVTAVIEALKKAADYMGEMGYPEDVLEEARLALAGVAH